MVISQHTIDSGIVKDILAELANDEMKGKYLCGGLSAQFLLPQELHRRTSDIDLESIDKMTSGSFHDYIIKASSPVTNRGYNLNFSKQRQTYDAIFKRDGHQMSVQITRRSNKKFGEVKERLHREYDNSREFVYAEGKLRIINPNDLIARKIGRADMFRRQYGLNVHLNVGVSEGIEIANIAMETLDLTEMDPVDVANRIAGIRMLADVADIRAVIANTQIDEKYIRQAILEYPAKNTRSLNSLLTEILSSF